MTVQERIQAAIGQVPEEELAALETLIRDFVDGTARRPGVLARISRIKIQGPEDFSSNLDDYLNREQTLVRKSNPD